MPEIDQLVPCSIDFRRGEIELFDPSEYITRASAPFVDAYVRSPACPEVVTTDLDDYLAWYAPAADACRAEPLRHIFMVNRCGSTLLLNALARGQGVAAFNELDPWSTSLDPDRAAQLERIDDALGAHLRTWSARTDRRIVLKHRAEVLLAAPRLFARFPTSRAVFLVRHWQPVIASQLAVAPGSHPGGVLAELAERSPSLVRWHPELAAETYAAFYLDTVARYRALAATGAAVACLRYEALVRDPVRAVTAAAEFLGVPAARAAQILEEAGHDSHARAAGRAEPFAGSERAQVALTAAIRDELESAWHAALPHEL